MDKQNMKAVLVTTEHRGVFFGYIPHEVGEVPPKEALKLQHARNVIYWSASMNGFLGLAAIGPDGSCKVGPAVSSLVVYDITSVTECAEKAVEKWEALP